MSTGFRKRKRPEETPRPCSGFVPLRKTSNVVPSESIRASGELGDRLRQARQLARCRVLVQHAASHAARQLRLDSLERFGGGRLVASGKRGLDLLDESPDAACLSFVRLQGSPVFRESDMNRVPDTW